MSRLIVIDGYNLILRAPELKPGPDRTLRDARDKLVNLLAWTIGGGSDDQFMVIFDGVDGGRDEKSGRVQVRFSRPPDKADDVIRRIVEEQVEKVDRLTVVTSDLEVARHARAMGADISISDLFIASVMGPVRAAAGEPENEKPTTTLSKKEVEEWAELFRRGKPEPDGDTAPEGETQH